MAHPNVSDCAHGPNRQRDPDGNIAAPGRWRKADFVCGRRFGAAFGDGANHAAQADNRHGDGGSDGSKRKPEIEVVDDCGLLHVDALRPMTEDSGLLQERRGHDVRADGSDKSSHYYWKGQHETHQNRSQIGADSRLRGGQNLLRVGREVNHRVGKNDDRLGENQPGDGGNQYIYRAPADADHRADGKDAPAPAFFLRAGFSQSGRACSGNGRKGKRQSFHIAGETKQGVAQTPRVHARENLEKEHQADRWQPVGMQKSAAQKRRRTGRRHNPVRNFVGNAQSLREWRADQILRPDETGKHAAREYNSGNSVGSQGRTDVIKQVNFLLLQGLI